MKHLFLLLILFPCFLNATIGDSKEVFEKKYGKQVKTMYKGQVIVYKKDKLTYYAQFYEKKCIVLEVDFGRVVKDKEVEKMIPAVFPGVKLEWSDRNDCWQDKKKTCIVRYMSGQKVVFIDAINDYKRVKEKEEDIGIN